MAPRASNVFVALTCAVVFSSFSSTAYAQSCKINNCAVGSTCSPVEIDGGSVGKCAPPGAQGVAECHCLGTLPPPPTPSIQFLITTGGDNLRGDSSTTATLFATTGAQRQVITLKDQNQPSWDNNTLHSVVSELNTPASTLDHIDITLTSHPGFGEGADNWNIQEVEIIVFNDTDVGSKKLADPSGNPLARLTGDAPTFTVPVSVQ